MAKDTHDRTRTRTFRARDAAATREAIVHAAITLFSESSYETVGVRKIATRAGVDAALINHYFGSKMGLFEAAVAHAVHSYDMVKVIATAERSSLGAELARMTLMPEEDEAREWLLLMLRAAASPATAPIFAAYRQGELAPLEAALGGEDAHVRADLLVAAMTGAAALRLVIAPHGMSEAQFEEFAAQTGRAMQRYVDGTM